MLSVCSFLDRADKLSDLTRNIINIFHLPLFGEMLKLKEKSIFFIVYCLLNYYFVIAAVL